MSENIASIDLSNETEILSTKGMTTKVVKGSIWTLAGQILPLFASLVSTPFIIRFLGSESYGVLILVGLIPTYISFADFGMGIASTKFGSEAYGQGLRKKEGEIIRTAAFVAFLTSLVFAIPVFLFSSVIIADWLKVPEHLQSSASVALKITSVSFVIGIFANIFNTPQLARLRMDLNTIINAVPKFLMAVVTPFVLFLGGGVVEAVWVALFAALLILVGHLLVSGKLLPELYQKTINKSAIRPLIKFGGSVVLYGIGLILLSNLEKLLLTRLVSVKSLAYYSVAFTFANMTTMFSMAMVQSLIPAFSQLLTPEKRTELDALFSRALRISLVGLLPSIMVLFVIARPFFTIWAGAEFGLESVYPFYILLSGIFFSIMVYVPNCLIMSYGRPDINAKVYWIELLPYAVIAFFLINSFGILGAALAWSLRETLNAFIFIWLTKRIVGVSFNFFSLFVSLALGVFILMPPMLFAVFYNNFSLWLIPFVAISMSLYLLLIWKRLVNKDEKVWIKNKIGMK